MKIQKLETWTNEYVCFVKVTTSDGATGWGQVAPYNADITASVVHRMVSPYVLGEEIVFSAVDFTHINKMMEKITEREHKFPGSFLRRAMAGFETALWDLLGKRHDLPVCALIGGTAGSVRAYASSMKREIKPTDEADRLLKLRDDFGFDAFKFRIASECGHDIDEWPGRTEAIVPAVRKALGNDVALLVDANSGYSPAKAIEVGQLLGEHDICHFEEPCPYWEYEQTKQVTDALRIDVTGGEQDCELQNWRRMVEERVVDIVQPDICYLGGISRTLQVAQIAQKANLPCTPHCANLSMVTLFTMHLLRAIPNAGKYLEFSIEGEDYYPWQTDLFVNSPFAIEDGKATVTDAPGWGVEINPQWLERSAYQISE